MTARARRRPERIRAGLPRRQPPHPEDVRGMAFWRLTAVRFIGMLGLGDAVWQCRCACGGRCDVALSALRAGATQSCARCAPPPVRGAAPSRRLIAARRRRATRLRREAEARAAERLAQQLALVLPPRPLISDAEMERLYAPYGGAHAYGGDNEYHFKEPGRAPLPAATVVCTKTALG